MTWRQIKAAKSVNFLLALVVGACMCAFLGFTAIVALQLDVALPWWAYLMVVVGLFGWLGSVTGSH